MQSTHVKQPVIPTSKRISQAQIIAPRKNRYIPSVEISHGKYSVRFARSLSEVRKALDLQNRVFELELNNESNSSLYYKTFAKRSLPSNCLYLIVLDKSADEVVGTYRISTIETVGTVDKFFSAHEFNLLDLPPSVISQSIEISRLCILKEHRNKQVLFLLWKGLANHLTNTKKRYLFGCCSIFSQDFGEARRAFENLGNGGFLHRTLSVSPTKKCQFTEQDIEKASCDGEMALPTLFGSYLKIGAKICSEPAIDREFKTVDFFMLFDLKAMTEKYFRMFFA